MEEWGFLCGQRYLIFDRDSKFCSSFRHLIRLDGIKPITLPPMSPNLKAYASHCTSSVRFAMISATRGLVESFCPCILTGGWSPALS